MITSQEKESCGILNLERQQQTNSLNALLASVDVVTHPKILGAGLTWISNQIEKTQQIDELAMYVAENLDWR